MWTMTVLQFFSPTANDPDCIPTEDWKWLLGHPRITWIKTVLNHLESHNFTIDWSSQYDSELPTLEVTGCEWCYALLVQARNKWQMGPTTVWASPHYRVYGERDVTAMLVLHNTFLRQWNVGCTDKHVSSKYDMAVVHTIAMSIFPYVIPRTATYPSYEWVLSQIFPRDAVRHSH